MQVDEHDAWPFAARVRQRCSTPVSASRNIRVVSYSFLSMRNHRDSKNMAITAEQAYIATIVFLDIVSYSKTSNKEQVRLKSELNRAISEALEGIKRDDLIVLDTGDGAALGFVSNPESGLRFAKRFRDGLLAAADEAMQVRIGLHMGPITVLEDLNGQKNMVGDGINSAQRVMSFSEPGQVLVSQAYHDTAIRLDQEYEGLFTAARKFSDKHGRTHLCHGLRGNPSSLQTPKKQSDKPSSKSTPSPQGKKTNKILLLALAAGIVAALGITWQLNAKKDPIDVTPEPPVESPTPIPNDRKVNARVIESHRTSETIQPAPPPQDKPPVTNETPPDNPAASKQAAPSKAVEKSPRAKTERELQTKPAGKVEQPAASTSTKENVTKNSSVAPIDCPECNCTELLTKLSMGTEPITSTQKAFLRQNCR